MINALQSNQSNTDSLPPPTGLGASSPASAPAHVSRARIPSFIRGTLRKRNRKRSAPSHLPFEWRVPADVGFCLAKALGNRWQTYRKQLRQCQKEFSESSIHQLRVASRRLMTQYALLSGLTSDRKTEKAWQKAKRRVKTLGELRDIQVQRKFIEQWMPRFPGLSLFLHRREQRLAKSLAAKVHGFKTGKLEKWTLAFCQELATWPKDARRQDALARNVFRTLSDAFAEVVRRRQAIERAYSETIHRTRVAFKQFRYMVEAVSPAFTGLGRGHLRRLGDYQTRMGNLQDLEMMQARVAAFLQEHPQNESVLQPFCRYLTQRRSRVLRSCISHADDLFGFGHPAWRADHEASVARAAA